MEIQKIHMVLQGKGGVGKTLVSSLLAQYLSEGEKTPLMIDTDPVNKTFSGYKNLDVKLLEIMDGDEINPRNFDSLVEQIAATKNDVIIDNGAASFVPLSSYLLSHDVPDLLASMDRELIVHTVVTGGQGLDDTVSGFAQLVQNFTKNVTFVVWLNPFMGKIEYEGKDFEKMAAYTKNKARVTSLIKIPELAKQTHGQDFEELLKSRRTFQEALEDPELPIMVRQRLTGVWRDIKAQLAVSTIM